MSNEIIAANAAPDMVQGMYCSLHAETQEEKLAVYDAVSNSAPLDDMVGKVIEIEDVIIQPVEVNDPATGEVRDANRIVMICADGNAYGCTSSGVETSMKNLMSIVGMPPWNPGLRMEVQKKTGRNGFKFTTLQYAK